MDDNKIECKPWHSKHKMAMSHQPLSPHAFLLNSAQEHVAFLLDRLRSEQGQQWDLMQAGKRRN